VNQNNGGSEKRNRNVKHRKKGGKKPAKNVFGVCETGRLRPVGDQKLQHLGRLELLRLGVPGHSKEGRVSLENQNGHIKTKVGRGNFAEKRKGSCVKKSSKQR